MSEDRIEKLLHMHKFYSEEARQQRSMMWETVKWFTTILTGLSAFWISYFVKNEPPAFLLIFSSLSGVILSFICIFLLRSFYRTNIKHITMFAKVEEALDFDMRHETERERLWPGDDRFTWEGYITGRTIKSPKNPRGCPSQGEKYYTSREYFDSITKDCLPIIIEKILIKINNYIFSSRLGYATKEAFSIYDLMKWVFYLFSLCFIIALILSISKFNLFKIIYSLAVIFFLITIFLILKYGSKRQ